MLTYKRIFLMWLPLAGMWFLIGVEQPAITSIIARLADAKTQLAAFGVAFSFFLIMMSPVMQLLTTATALATDRKSYRTLFGFTLLLCGGMTLVQLIFECTPAFEFFCTRIFSIPPEVVEPARRSFIVMTPFVLFVGLRRLWQGVLIRYGKTSLVAIAMVARVVTVVVVLIGGVWLTRLEGATLGGLALTVGAGASALATFLSVRRIVGKDMPEAAPQGGRTLTWRGLGTFYLPLGLTGVVNLAGQPLYTFGIALAVDSLDSLAVWPVVMAFQLMFVSVVFSYQDIVVALYKGEEEFKKLKRYSIRLAAASSVVLVLVALLPLSAMWYRYVSGLSPELETLTKLPMIVLTVVPALVTFISWYRGVLIVRKETVHVIRGALIYLSALSLTLFIGVSTLPVSGVLMAAIAWPAGLAAEALFLRSRVYRIKKTAL